MKSLLFILFPFLVAFAGPGPRSDGRIYVNDYITAFPTTTPYSAWDQIRYTPNPDITGIQNAENDAALICTSVEWASSVYYAKNIQKPPCVINEGIARSITDTKGTVIVAWGSSADAIFILANGGEHKFSRMQLDGPNGIRALDPVNSLILDDIGIGITDPVGSAVDLESNSNYPVHISNFGFNGGAYGVKGRYLGNTVIENGKFSGQTVYPIALYHPTSTTSQFLTVRGIDFSLVNGPWVYIESPATNIIIDSSESERYVFNPHGDIVFNASVGGGLGMVKISNSSLGSNAKYSVEGAPGFTLMENDGLGAPVQSNSPSNIIFSNCAGECRVVAQ